MTHDDAKTILKDWLSEDGGLNINIHEDNGKVEWDRACEETAYLEGEFTGAQLEALGWWMQHGHEQGQAPEQAA